ncbi:hypothetical protein, partial [Yersinia sp. 2542 StPb PI]|uniref:hypothetical protein n=1 Tax=Yersinia sp. 2542 StPb PI TaxID=3117408 RepID=UPI003B27ED52
LNNLFIAKKRDFLAFLARCVGSLAFLMAVLKPYRNLRYIAQNKISKRSYLKLFFQWNRVCMSAGFSPLGWLVALLAILVPPQDSLY